MVLFRKSKLAIDKFGILTSKNPSRNSLSSRTNLGFSPKPHYFSRTNLLKQNQIPQLSRLNFGFSQLGPKQNQISTKELRFSHSFSRTNLGFLQFGHKQNQNPQFLKTNIGFSQLRYTHNFSRQNLGFSQFGIKKLQNPQIFTTGARRSYYVDSNQIQHFRPRGYRKWFQNSRKIPTVALISSGLAITIYLWNLETIPYTKRKHLVLLSKSQEKKLGEACFRHIKRSYKRKILPKNHPESVRVRHIAKKVIGALKRGLNHEKAQTDLGDRAERDWGGERKSGFANEAMSESREGNWYKEDEVLNDRWVRESGNKKGSKPNTSHLNSLKWEVIVVDEPEMNAFCLPGGKIVFFTGLLKHFSDLEIATVMGHEVGHVVARHGGEGITKNFGYAIVQWVLSQVVIPDVVDTMSNLFLKLPFSRRMEMEADYIGLLLMASAGYNPRLAPAVYEKMEKITGEIALQDYLSTHPSGKKRAKLLSRAQVMEEAMGIYRKVLVGKGVEGFL